MKISVINYRNSNSFILGKIFFLMKFELLEFNIDYSNVGYLR